jgi:hypothetical protein
LSSELVWTGVAGTAGIILYGQQTTSSTRDSRAQAKACGYVRKRDIKTLMSGYFKKEK